MHDPIYKQALRCEFPLPERSSARSAADEEPPQLTCARARFAGIKARFTEKGGFRKQRCGYDRVLYLQDFSSVDETALILMVGVCGMFVSALAGHVISSVPASSCHYDNNTCAGR